MKSLEFTNDTSLPDDIIREATICRGFFEYKVNQLKGAPKSSKDLACYCAIASWFLNIRIKKLGYSDVHFVLGFYKGDKDHCWVNVQDQIIDITATQFGVPFRVYTPTNKIQINEFHAHYRDKSAIEQLKKWPKEQAIFLRKNDRKFQSYVMKEFKKFLEYLPT